MWMWGENGTEISAREFTEMVLLSLSRVNDLGQLLLKKNSFKMIYSLKGKEADVYREKNCF